MEAEVKTGWVFLKVFYWEFEHRVGTSVSVSIQNLKADYTKGLIYRGGPVTLSVATSMVFPIS